MGQPLKRDKALEPLSHDHHHGLMLCFKIKQGLTKQIGPDRILAYARFFYETQLAQHFMEEEEYLFPLLGEGHPMVQRALDEHRQLYALFFTENDERKACAEIAEKLKAHIRFEERELFEIIQQTADRAELQRVNRHLHPRLESNPDAGWEDQFWL